MTAPRLHVECHEGDGPPVLFVHGFLASARYWELNLPAMKQVCSPVVVELWGHGRSPSPIGEAVYGPLGYVEQFESLRSDLGVERWSVVGHSLGGALSIRYALERPDVVRSVVFTNSRAAFAVQEVGPESGALAAKVERRGMQAFERHPMNPATSKRLPPAMREVLTEGLFNHDPVGIASTLRHTAPVASVLGDAAELRVPALLTWGVYEEKFEAGAAAAQELVVDLQVVRLEAGHAVNIGDQLGFDQAVADFLSPA